MCWLGRRHPAVERARGAVKGRLRVLKVRRVEVVVGRMKGIIAGNAGLLLVSTSAP